MLKGTKVDIVVEECLLTHKRKKTSGKNHWVRTHSWVLKRRRLINDQVLNKTLYIGMSMSNKRIPLDEDWIWECKRWRIEGFFSCGSANKIRGSRASNLATLGFGWEEKCFHFFFPSSGTRLLFYVLKLW